MPPPDGTGMRSIPTPQGLGRGGSLEGLLESHQDGRLLARERAIRTDVVDFVCKPERFGYVRGNVQAEMVSDQETIEVDRDGIQLEILDDMRPDIRLPGLDSADLGRAVGRNADRQGRAGKIPVIPQINFEAVSIARVDIQQVHPDICTQVGAAGVDRQDIGGGAGASLPG